VVKFLGRCDGEFRQFVVKWNLTFHNGKHGFLRFYGVEICATWAKSNPFWGFRISIRLDPDLSRQIQILERTIAVRRLNLAHSHIRIRVETKSAGSELPDVTCMIALIHYSMGRRV
jgi:hypothetical protein